jgi:hypothetical protein
MHGERIKKGLYLSMPWRYMGGSRNIVPLILTTALHGRQWSSMFMPCLVDTWGKRPQYLLKRSLGGTQSLYGHFREEKTSVCARS